MNLGADRPVARAQLLPPLRARPAARAATRTRPKRNIFGADRSAPRARARRHPPAPVRPGDHRDRSAGKRIHPAWAVPGGVDAAAHRRRARRDPAPWLPEALAIIASSTLDLRSSASWTSFREEVAHLRQLPHACSWAWSTPDGGAGALRRQAAHRGRRTARSSPTSSTRRATTSYIGEAVEPWTLPEVPLLQAARAIPDGMYRVGPLARLNVADALRHAARRPGAGRVPAARPRRGAQLLPLPLRAADRDPVLRRADRGAAGDPEISTPHVLAFARRNRSRASAAARRRAARCSTTTR